jgi:hypothetical protein
MGPVKASAFATTFLESQHSNKRDRNDIKLDLNFTTLTFFDMICQHTTIHHMSVFEQTYKDRVYYHLSLCLQT